MKIMFRFVAIRRSCSSDDKPATVQSVKCSFYPAAGLSPRQTIFPLSVAVLTYYNIKGHLARMELGRSVFKILIGTLTEIRSVGRIWRTWEDNIRMYLKEIVIHTRNWGNTAQDRYYRRALVNSPLFLRVP